VALLAGGLDLLLHLEGLFGWAMSTGGLLIASLFSLQGGWLTRWEHR
jgi:hypothetical protein